jgi:hypothetical protein
VVAGLEIVRRDGRRVASLWAVRNGYASRATDTMRPDIERWLRDGLVEVTGRTEGKVTRRTPPDHPEFLSRLASHVRLHGMRAYLLILTDETACATAR